MLNVKRSKCHQYVSYIAIIDKYACHSENKGYNNVL